MLVKGPFDAQDAGALGPRTKGLLTRLEERLAFAATAADKRAAYMLVDTYAPAANVNT